MAKKIDKYYMAARRNLLNAERRVTGDNWQEDQKVRWAITRYDMSSMEDAKTALGIRQDDEDYDVRILGIIATATEYNNKKGVIRR